MIGIGGGGGGGAPGAPPVGIGGGGGGAGGAVALGSRGAGGAAVGPVPIAGLDGAEFPPAAERGRGGAMVPKRIEAKCLAPPAIGPSSSEDSSSLSEPTTDQSSSSGRTREGRAPVGWDTDSDLGTSWLED
jgi:hypothetical protein